MTLATKPTEARVLAEVQDSVLNTLAPGWKQQQVSTPSSGPVISRRRTAAVYMRYSTDLQDPYSFERQRRVAETYAEQLGVDIVRIYADAGKSGAYTANRPAFQEMFEAAERHEFEVVIVEEGDRLSRKLSIMANAYSKLAELGIELHSSKHGRWSLMHCAFAGLMSEDQKNRIFDLLRSGRVKILGRGLWPGTAPYGYKKLQELKGDMRIVPKHATIVRRIYGLALTGVTPERIARILQQEGVPAPKGAYWYARTILYILRNPIYVGAAIFFKTKRTQIQKNDHEIITRIDKRPVNEWHYAERCDWIILKLETWQAVQALPRQQKKGPGPTYLLSRLVYCGGCGKPMSLGTGTSRRDIQYMQCTAQRVARIRKQRSPCKAHCVRFDTLHEEVVDLVIGKLRNPDSLKLMRLGFGAKAAQDFRSCERERAQLRKERIGIAARLDETYDDALNVGMTKKAIVERRQVLCARMDEIDDRLAGIPIVRVAANSILRAPSDIDPFVKDLRENRNYSNCSATHAKILAIFRSLVEKIIVNADWTHKTVDVRIQGPIAFVEETGELQFSFPTPWALTMKRRISAVAAQVDGNILNDDDWEKLRVKLHDEPIWIEGFTQPIGLRSVLNAMIFQKRVEIGRLSLPDVFGPTKQIWAAAQKLSHGGIIDIIQAVMREENIEVARDIDFNFDSCRTTEERTWERYHRLNMLRKARVLDRACRSADEL